MMEKSIICKLAGLLLVETQNRDVRSSGISMCYSRTVGNVLRVGRLKDTVITEQYQTTVLT